MTSLGPLMTDVLVYGDRTSSFLSAYAHFRDECVPQGRLRVVDVPGALVVAGEPLCPGPARADAFFALAESAREVGRQTVIMPVGSVLAAALRQRGARTLCVGAEPVLELDTWLGEVGGSDPLERLPVARALGRRGARVEAWDSAALTDEQRASIEDLAQRWRTARTGPLVDFLNVVDPLQLVKHKALFVVFDGKLLGPAAVLAAVPVAAPDGSGRVDAWFFADSLRHPDARAGCIELLTIEAARALRARGAREVRLGLCPLMHLQQGDVDGILEKLVRPALARHQQRARFPFSLSSVARFKEKLGPSRWDPLYLATDGPRDLRLVRALAWAHFPEGPLTAWTEGVRTLLRQAVRPEVVPLLRHAPRTMREAFTGGVLVWSAALLFSVLHFARWVHPAIQDVFLQSRFVPQHITVQGILCGPLFHNHAYHLCGDLLSLLFFGLLLEWAAGHLIVAVVGAFGLWATNPLSTWWMTPLLAQFRPQDLPRFLAEGDVGSSNAVYAIVGTVAAGLKRPGLLLVPFAANGIYLCVVKASWLSVHHLIGLLGGYAVGVGWRFRLGRRRDLPFASGPPPHIRNY
jgi:hypothetical protein